MRLAIPLLLPALLAGCAADPLPRAAHLMPRPAPYEPAPPLGAFGPVLSPETTVPYSERLPGL